MTYNLDRAIFGVLEDSPDETATTHQIAAGTQFPFDTVKRKLIQLSRGGYVTRLDVELWKLLHDLDLVKETR